MARRQRVAAAKRRRLLVRVLGGVCQWCYERKRLEIDVIEPNDKLHHRRMSSDQRIAYYVKQFQLGNLQLLCSECHHTKHQVPF